MLSFNPMKTRYGIIAIAGLLFLGAGCSGNGSVSIIDTVVSATRLDLSGSGLDKVPSSVFEKTGLRELDLSNNRLTGALPSQIQQLENLRVLDASGNKMTGVPAEIGQLSHLEELDLSDNALTGLPFELGNLQNLRFLDLRGNTVSRQDLEVIRRALKGTEILE